MTGHHHDRRGVGTTQQLGQEVHPPHIGELVIEQDDVGLGGRGERELRAPDMTDPGVPFHLQQVPHQPRHRRIVLDQEDGDVHPFGHRATTRVSAACTSGSMTVPTRSAIRSTACAGTIVSW